MMRLTIMALLAVVFFGCQGQDAKAPLDPFYGQTKIPPPGTGEITRRPAADPYYPRSATNTGPNGLIQPPPMAGVGTAGMPAASLAGLPAPPDTDNLAQASRTLPGDRIDIPLTALREMPPVDTLAASDSGRSAEAASAPVALTASLHDRERVIQTLSPRQDAVSHSPATYSRPRPTLSRRGAVDITDLPPARSGVQARRDDRVQQASAIEPAGQVTVRTPTRVDGSSGRKRYGYATDYGRLRGKLEYLESEQRWKLRYIPIDGVTDDYGGSVMIEDARSLSGFERGEFVELRGEIVEQADDDSDFAPSYRVADIHALAK